MKHISLFLLIIIALSCNKELEITEVYTGDTQNITSNSVVCLGKVSSNGNPDFSEKGICWSTLSNPTIENNKKIAAPDQDNFTINITGLEPETNYFIKAYAIINSNVVYGEQEQFTTYSALIPTIATTEMSNITATSAFSGGHLISDGGEVITSQGICWNDSGNPTVSDNPISATIGVLDFDSNIIALTSMTTYYVKAYAINDIGIAYGEEISFTTCEIITGDVLFSTQEQINNFSSHCISEIAGNLVIQESSDADITDLSPLNSLTKIEGDLKVHGNIALTSLEGLNNIETVLADVIIEYNTNLTSLDGLDNLSSIGHSLEIRENDNLVSLSSLNLLTLIKTMRISYNNKLSNLSGLDNLVRVSGRLFITNNDLLTDLNSLQNLTSIGVYFVLSGNDSLEYLAGLDNLESIGTTFNVTHNLSLKNLDGLIKLNHVGWDLSIFGNTDLTDLCGLSTLIVGGGLGGEYTVSSNGYNPTAIDIIDGNCSL